MKTLLFLLTALLFQDLPYKAKEEFEIKVDFQFKSRPPVDKDLAYEATQRVEKSGAMLPYLILKVNVLALKDQEIKVRISNNLKEQVATKKVQVGTSLLLDMGFTDDIKDAVSPNDYTLTFLNNEKKAINRIRIRIDEDGTFFVNDEKRGKF